MTRRAPCPRTRKRPRCLALAIAGLLGALCACAPRPLAQEADPATRVTHWFTMGPLDEQRPMRTVLLNEGWHGVTRRLEPVIAWFVDAGQTPRLLIHLPFATEGGDYPMDYDAYRRANASRLWLTRDFDAAWAEVRERHPDLDVIFYVGAIGLDRQMLGHLDAAQAGDPTAVHRWMDHALAGIQPLLDAGGSIGFDAGGRVEPDSPERLFIDTIDALFEREGRGRRVYIEPLTYRDKPAWTTMPAIIASQFWEKARVERVGRYVELADMQSEVMILIARPPPGEDKTQWPRWYLAYAREALAATGSVAVDVTRLQKLRVDYATFVAPNETEDEPVGSK